MAAISALKKRVAELEAENEDLRRRLADAEQAAADKPAPRKATAAKSH